MKKRTLYLKPCPTSGEDGGVHKWLYYAACRCVEARMTDEEAEPLIEKMMAREPKPASEILDALRSARAGCRNQPDSFRSSERPSSRRNDGGEMAEAPGSMHFAEEVDFPPCSSMEQVILAEGFLFAILPMLTQFIRPATPAERAAGITNGYESVLVTKANGRIGRTYGQSIRLN